MSLAKAGQYDEALALVDHSLATTQDSPPLLITQINLYRVLRRPEDMARIFDKFAQLVPNRAISLRIDQINTLYKLGRKDRARAETAALLASRAASVADLELLQRLWWQYDPVPFDRQTIKPRRTGTTRSRFSLSGGTCSGRCSPSSPTISILVTLKTFAQPALPSICAPGWAWAGPARSRSLPRNCSSRIWDNVDALLLRAGFEARGGPSRPGDRSGAEAMNSDQTDPEVYVVLAQLQAKAGAVWRGAQIFEDGLRLMPQSYLLIERYTQFLHHPAIKAGRFQSRGPLHARSLRPSWPGPSWRSNARGPQTRLARRRQRRVGRRRASTYLVDDRPGTPPDRGLLGKF